MHSLHRYASIPALSPYRGLVQHHHVLRGVQHIALPRLLHGFLPLAPISRPYVAVRVVVDQLGHALRHVQTRQRVVEAQRLLQEAENVLRHQLALIQIFPRQPALHLVVLR